MYVKRGFRPLVTLFFVLGAMFFAATSASAQTGTLPTVQVSDLQSPSNTISILMSRVTTIHQNLPTLSGSALTGQTMRVQYYKAIIYRINNNGESVPQALSSALKSAIILDETKTSLPAGIEKTLEQIYQETVTLLSI